MKTQNIANVGVILKRRRRIIGHTQEEIAIESGLSQKAVAAAEAWFPGSEGQAPTLRSIHAISSGLDRLGAPQLPLGRERGIL
ncbi:MAG: hypothetical protein JRE40_02340 [Deltaproteobacteria bacterium]|nr:hypothetical protein [Deltaproteobacteria bacterium]